MNKTQFFWVRWWLDRGVTAALPTFPSWFGQQRGFTAAAALTDSRTLQASGCEHSGSRWRTWLTFLNFHLISFHKLQLQYLKRWEKLNWGHKSTRYATRCFSLCRTFLSRLLLTSFSSGHKHTYSTPVHFSTLYSSGSQPFFSDVTPVKYFFSQVPPIQRRHFGLKKKRCDTQCCASSVWFNTNNYKNLFLNLHLLFKALFNGRSF